MSKDTNCQGCAVQQGTHKPAEALSAIAEPTQKPDALRKEYRATIPHEVLHLWAKDALACIADLEAAHQRELTAYRTTVQNLEAEIAALKAAPAMDAARAQQVLLLAADHNGMRVDYTGLLGQVRREICRSGPGYAEMLRQLQGHIQELGQRWYAGETAAVDEFLQLYSVEKDARAAIAASGAQGKQ